MSSTIGGTDTASGAGWSWAPQRREDEQDERRKPQPAGPLEAGTARRTAPSVQLSQQDFDVASRLLSPAVGRTLEQVTNLPKLDPKPWSPGRQPAANPYQSVLGALRIVAARRDAAAVLAERELDAAVDVAPPPAEERASAA